MSFGFSVGDFVTVGSLITETVALLRAARSSPADYDDLLTELHTLERALKHLDGLHKRNEKAEQLLESIKFSAASCQKPLESFLKKIKKYETSLGGASTKHTLRTLPRRVQWQLSIKDECVKLRNYLNLHISTINTLLLEFSLETLDLHEKAAADNSNVVKELILQGEEKIGDVSRDLHSQTQLITRVNAAVETMIGTVAEWSGSWKTLNEMVSRICVSTQQIYIMIVEIKSTMLDVRWTHFQAPLQVEDALGIKFPVPSEYDFATLQVIIQQRYQEGPIAEEVRSGEYELSYATNSKVILDEGTPLRPGSQVIMGVILEGKLDSCPIPSCSSTALKLAPGGGKECVACGVWFDKSAKSPDISRVPRLNEPKERKHDRNLGEDSTKRVKMRQQRDVSQIRNIRCRARYVLLKVLDYEYLAMFAKPFERAPSSEESPDHYPIYRFVCTYNDCGAEFTRKWDLRRHHVSVHMRAGEYRCRRVGCSRALKGFVRKDKRDDHERFCHRRFYHEEAQP